MPRFALPWPFVPGQDQGPDGFERKVQENFDALAGAVGRATRASPWHEVGATGEPQFQNGWTHKAPSPADNMARVAFKKTPDGTVHIRGVATGGAGNTTIFTLPAGYRPTKERRLPGWSWTGAVDQFCLLFIHATGDVQVHRGHTGESTVECSFQP